METYPDLPLDTDSKLLIEPYLYRRVLLQQFEDKVDGRKEHPSATSTTTSSRCHLYSGCLRGLFWGVGGVWGGF